LNAIGATVTIATLVFVLVGTGIAYKTYEVAADTAKKQLRSYVGVDKVSVQFPSLKVQNYNPTNIKAGDVETDFIVFALKNAGSTPALHVKTYASWVCQPFPAALPADFSFPDKSSNFPQGVSLITSDTPLLPQSSLQTSVAVHDIRPFVGAIQKKNALYLYGHVDYEDIYGEKHKTNFCYAYQPYGTLHQFNSYSSHNEID
jgi:hypothetical protein